MQYSYTPTSDYCFLMNADICLRLELAAILRHRGQALAGNIGFGPQNFPQCYLNRPLSHPSCRNPYLCSFWWGVCPSSYVCQTYTQINQAVVTPRSPWTLGSIISSHPPYLLSFSVSEGPGTWIVSRSQFLLCFEASFLCLPSTPLLF